ncbi:hypothetical protein DVR12_21565 [Chitinophaga silvatica]|uniref:Uncharacterized protein n=1 Tax=Chitinophaga silvatica TaxID=2282649 RepID=A0A3E1Y4S0_9BACT|nr:hypothetical protein DVR12_21565 [Chitinophaga silvatica]
MLVGGRFSLSFNDLFTYLKKDYIYIFPQIGILIKGIYLWNNVIATVTKYSSKFIKLWHCYYS